MTDAIPAIDIDALNSPDASIRREVAGELGRACREIGFFVIRRHGVPESLIARSFAASRAFFAVPDEAKQALAAHADASPRGYAGPTLIAPGSGRSADYKEVFTLNADGDANGWPAISGWRETMQSCLNAMLEVSRTLHRGFALDLGLDEHAFDAAPGHPPRAVLRMFRYPAAWGSPATTGHADPNAGVHTDRGGLTLVAPGDVGRLQLLGSDGRWIEVPAPKGAFVCNVGDGLMRWTNGAYLSARHRVLQPQQERHSIVLFVEAPPEAAGGLGSVGR